VSPRYRLRDIRARFDEAATLCHARSARVRELTARYVEAVSQGEASDQVYAELDAAIAASEVALKACREAFCAWQQLARRPLIDDSGADDHGMRVGG